jgi:NAD(P)-dependent dehydrogenase (short-subunit alcohol dehydrogenase family)
MTEIPRKKILVTGGNSGIGLALCKQLVLEHDCHVFMGSRSHSRGEEALALLRHSLPEDQTNRIELIHLDVGEDASVAQAADTLRDLLREHERLYALVNNAGTGLAAGAPPEEVINTNLYGVKRMTDAFVRKGLVSERVVNVGSGSGPSYVRRCPPTVQPDLCRTPESWAQIESFLETSPDGKTGLGSEADVNGGYGLSKAMLALYTMLCAKEMPEILSSCVSPGWIKTKLVGSGGATKKPEEGTSSIRHCLFEELQGNGWYYGSDCVRSPLHFMRNPGEPAYDGRVDGVVGQPD